MVNITYTYCKDLDIINEFTIPDNFICNINVADASYAIDTLGYIYPNIRIKDSIYLDYIGGILSNSISLNIPIRIYVDVPDIFQYDQFEVYVVEDSYPHDEHFALLWKFRSRRFNNYDIRSISLKYKPFICPICGEPLSDNDIFEFEDIENIKKCINPHCWMNKYTAINRYLTIACNLPELTKFAKSYIDIGKVQIPSDLYKLDVFDTIFLSDPPIEKQLEMLASTRGKIKLSKYLLALPVIDYSIDGFMIKPDNIDFDMTPSRFIVYINTLTKHYVDIQNTYTNSHIAFKEWLERYGSDINDYMSIPAFFEYAKYFYNNTKNEMALTELERMKIFSGLKFFN